MPPPKNPFLKRLILSLEVSNKPGNQSILEADFYEAQGSPEAARHHTYACRSSGAEPPPRKEPSSSSIGRPLGYLPSRKNKAENCRGPYPKSDTPSIGGVQTILSRGRISILCRTDRQKDRQAEAAHRRLARRFGACETCGSRQTPSAGLERRAVAFRTTMLLATHPHVGGYDLNRLLKYRDEGIGFLGLVFPAIDELAGADEDALTR